MKLVFAFFVIMVSIPAFANPFVIDGSSCNALVYSRLGMGENVLSDQLEPTSRGEGRLIISLTGVEVKLRGKLGLILRADIPWIPSLSRTEEGLSGTQIIRQEPRSSSAPEGFEEIYQYELRITETGLTYSFKKTTFNEHFQKPQRTLKVINCQLGDDSSFERESFLSAYEESSLATEAVEDASSRTEIDDSTRHNRKENEEQLQEYQSNLSTTDTESR